MQHHAIHLRIWQVKLMHQSPCVAHVKIGIWMLLAIASIIILLQQRPRKPLWGLTLSFLLITLITNTVYLILLLNMAVVGFLQPPTRPSTSDVLPGFPLCSSRGIAASVLSTITVVLNDAFFVSKVRCEGIESHRSFAGPPSFSGRTDCSGSNSLT